MRENRDFDGEAIILQGKPSLGRRLRVGEWTGGFRRGAFSAAGGGLGGRVGDSARPPTGHRNGASRRDRCRAPRGN